MDNLTELLQQTQSELTSARARITALEMELAQAKLSAPPTEQRLSHLADYSWNVFTLVNERGAVVYVSPAITRVMGYTVAEYLEMELNELTHPDDQSLVSTVLQAILAVPDEPRTFEVRRRHKDGRWRWLETTAINHLHTPDVQAILLNCHDITDLKTAQLALQASVERYRLLSDSIPDALFVLGMDDQQNPTRLLEVNESTCQLLNYSRDELLHMTLADIDDPSAPPLPDVNKRFAAGELVVFEQTHVKRDGTRIPVEVHGRMGTIEGQPIAVALAHDISQRRITEQELHRFEAAVRQTDDAVVITDAPLRKSPRILFINEAFTKITGYTLQEAQDQQISILQLPGTKTRDHEDLRQIHTALENGTVYRGKTQSFHKNGTPLMLQWSITPVVDEQGKTTNYVAVVRDITEQELHVRQLQTLKNALQTERDHLNGILDTMQDAVLSISMPDRQLIYVSASFEQVFGYPLDAYLHDANFFKQMVYPDDLERAIQALQTCLREGFVEVEHRIVWPDGQVRWLLRRAWVNFDENGRPVRLNDSARDITARKQAETDLRHREENFRTLFNSLNDFLFVLDMQGNMLEVNQTVIQRLGHSQEELLHQSVLFVHPEDRREEASRIVADMLQGKCSYCSIPLSTRSGELIPVETYVSQGLWNGQMALFAVTKDISELKVSEEKFAAVFRANPALVGLSSIETGEYVEVNPAFCETLGFTPEEVIGKKASDLLHMDLEFRQRALEQLQRDGFVRNEETVIHTKDGTPVSVLLSAEILMLNNKAYNFTTALNITTRKTAEAAFRASETKQKALLAAIPDLMFHISPDGTVLDFHGMADELVIPRELLIGQNIQNFLSSPLAPDEIIQRTMQAIDQVRASRQLVVFEYDLPEGDERRVYEARLVPLGHTDEMLIIIRDITERKRAETALRTSEHKLRLFVEYAPAAIAMFDKDMKYVTVSRRWLSDYRLKDEDIAGRSHYDVFPEIPERVKEIHQRCLKGAVEKSDADPFPRADGTLDWVRWEVHPWRDGNGEIGGILLFSEVITERIRAQEALRATQDRYRLLAENMADVVWILDTRTLHFSYISPSVETLRGYTADEAILQPMDQIITPDSLATINRELPGRIQNFLSGDPAAITQRYEIEQYRRDGSTVWTEVVTKLLLDSTGAIEVLGISRDIDERKRAEADLRASEEKYRSLIESSEAAIAMFDERGDLLFANAIAARSFGVVPENMVGKNMKDLFPPQVANRQLTSIQTVIRTGVGQVNEAPSIVREGEHWYRTSVQPVRDASGQVNAALINSVDITATKQAETALRRSEAHLRSLVDSQTAFNIRIDMHGRISYHNERYKQQFGWLAPSLIGIPSLSMIAPDDHDKVLDAVAQCLANTVVPVQVELRKPRSDGSYMWTLWEFIAIQGDDGNVSEIQCVGFDISKQKQAEADLQALNVSLEQRVTERTAELEKVKNRIEAIFNHSGDAIVLVDVKEGIQQANYAFDQLLGIPVDGYFGVELARYIHPRNVPQFTATILDVAATHQTQQIDAEIQRSDGSIVDVEINIAPVNRSEQAVTNLVCIIRNVTERKQAELAIAEERNLLRTVIDAVPDFIYVKDVQHRMMLNNAAHARSLGLNSPVEAVGKTDFEIFPHDMAAKFHEDEECIFRTREAILNTEERSIGQDGQEIWAMTTKVPLFNLQGELTGLVGITHNVSEIKASENALRRSGQQLRESQKMLQSVLDTIPVRVFWKDRDSVYLGCNRLFAQDAGLTNTADIIGKRDAELPWGASDAPAYKSDDLFVMQSGISKLEYEENQTTASGKQLYLQTSKLPLRDAEDKIIGVLGAYVDITARKQTEAALRESEERYRLIAENVSDVIIKQSASRILTFASPSIFTMLGYNAEEIVGQMATNFVHPDDIPVTSTIVQRAVTSGSPYFTLTERLRHKDGRYIWVEVTNTNVFDTETKTLVEMVGVLRDITQRKAAEDALRDSEERYRLIAENVSDVIIKLSPAGNMTFATPSLASMMGYSLEEAIGHNGFELVHPDDLAASLNVVQQAAASAAPYFTLTERLRHKDGHYIWVEVTNTNVYDTETNELVEMVGVLRDITKRKAAEDALRESESRYRLLAENIRDVIVKLSLEGIITFITPSCYELTGHTAEELVGHPSGELIHPDDVIPVRDAAMQAMSSGTTFYTITQRLPHKDGHYVWVEVSNTIVWDKTTGHPIEIISILHDITERKRAEDALRESEERYRLLAENVNDVIVKLSPDGIHTFATSSSYRLLGYTPEELVGRPGFELIHPDDRAATLQLTIEAFNSKAAFYTAIHRMQHKKGHYVWVEATSTIVRDPISGMPVEIVGTARDITQRKQAEDALRDSEERYRTTIAAMYEGIILQGTDGAIQLCNKAAEQILGLNKDQMMGRKSIDPLWRAIHEDGSPFPGEDHPAMVALRTGEPQSNIVMGVYKPDGALTWILINAQPLMAPDQAHPFAVVATFADITERKQAEQTLQQALAQEKELGELKSRFVSMASHEFRTPLAAILATSETLTFYREKMTPVQIDARLDKIRNQVMHMKDIMEDVLQLARIQAGRVEFKPAQGDLDALCRDIIEEFDTQPQYRGRIAYDCPAAPVGLSFDGRLMRQVISNLISNALKYSAAEKAVHIALTHDSTQVTLWVRDEGIGIPAEDLKRLFEPFHRATNVGTISGTGLGLSITRQAVEMHRGTIIPDSAVEGGTTFTVILPKSMIKDNE